METIASSTKDTAILRVKRKREDDPVDVFLFQVNNVHNSKKRGLLSPKAEQGHGTYGSLLPGRCISSKRNNR